MTESLGTVLQEFDSVLERLKSRLEPDQAVYEAVFKDTEEWTALLHYKLVPHLAGEGCLIVAVAGGTNTGKSTLFNMLAGQHISGVAATAAATCRPVIAANGVRTGQCFEGKLVPEFAPRPWADESDAFSPDLPPDALVVAEAPRLPDWLVLLDTPDVDSIERDHWAVADNLRAAGDVIVAALTAEKYMDERVVSFFREAHDSGRVVVPVLNKANPDDEFAVARRQLEEFRKVSGIDTPAFVLPHDFELAEGPARPIPSIEGDGDLSSYLATLDVPDIKQRVYRATVAHFASRAAEFLEAADGVAQDLRSVVEEFDERTWEHARQYDPAPGADVGGLFHEFVQSKRGPVRRWIGATSRAVAEGATRVAKTVRRAVLSRATLERGSNAPSGEEQRKAYAQAIEPIAKELASSLTATSRNVKEPANHLLRNGLARLDMEQALPRIVGEALHSENVSDEFRAHAQRLLETWWADNTGKRRVLEALDTMLAAAPSAIAAPIAIYMGGIGVPEAVVVAGPIVEQFVARVIEYQFGDAMFDFLSPWKEEQQQILKRAMDTHITEPITHGVREFLEALEGDLTAELRRLQDQCTQV